MTEVRSRKDRKKVDLMRKLVKKLLQLSVVAAVGLVAAIGTAAMAQNNQGGNNNNQGGNNQGGVIHLSEPSELTLLAVGLLGLGGLAKKGYKNLKRRPF